MNTRKRIVFFSTVLFVCLFSIGMFAQTSRDVRLPEREYVIGIDDQLDILAWKSKEFTTRVAVRSDGKITMPLLGDIQAAGLKVSMLKADLESRLAKYLKEPQVTVTVNSSKKIRIRVSGIIALENEFPRGTTLGQVLQGLIPTLQQLPTPPDLPAMKLIGVEEEFPFNGQAILEGRHIFANLRLEWGDEIFIPAQDLPEFVPPATVETPSPITRRAEFTAQEYTDFQIFLNDYPSAQEILSAFVTDEGEKVYIELEKIPEDQLQELEEDVLIELEKYAAEVQEELPRFIDATLMGISINLALEGLQEAFLAFPDPNSEEGIQIEKFQKGDIVEKGDTAANDIILDEIQTETNQVILKKGEETQVLQLLPSFSDITLSGVLDLGGRREAVLGNLKSNTMEEPVRRKRFKQGDEIEDDIILAEISNKWALLEKGEDIQLVFLRDSRNRTFSEPVPASLLTQNDQIPGTQPIEEGQALPEGLQMLDPSVLNQLQTQGQDLLMSPENIERLLVYNAFLVKLSQTLDDQGVSLTEVLRPLFRLARERTNSGGDPGAENQAVLLTLAMYVNGKSMGDLVGIGGAAPRPREVQVSLLNRPDLAKHFLVSAAITAIADSELADRVGLSKEVDDSQGGSGFSFADLTADRAGVRFAELATGSPRQAQALQQQMSGVMRESDFMPQVDRLPEGIMEEEFQQRYQDTESVAYRTVNEEIERRIAACPIYQ